MRKLSAEEKLAMLMSDYFQAIGANIPPFQPYVPLWRRVVKRLTTKKRRAVTTAQPDGVTLLRTLASINGQRVKEPTPELARMHAALKAGGLIVEAGRGTGWVSYALTANGRALLKALR